MRQSAKSAAARPEELERFLDELATIELHGSGREQALDRGSDLLPRIALAARQDPDQLAKDDQVHEQRAGGRRLPLEQGARRLGLRPVVGEKGAQQDVGVDADHRIDFSYSSTTASPMASSRSPSGSGTPLVGRVAEQVAERQAPAPPHQHPTFACPG